MSWAGGQGLSAIRTLSDVICLDFRLFLFHRRTGKAIIGHGNDSGFELSDEQYLLCSALFSGGKSNFVCPRLFYRSIINIYFCHFRAAYPYSFQNNVQASRFCSSTVCKTFILRTCRPTRKVARTLLVLDTLVSGCRYSRVSRRCDGGELVVILARFTGIVHQHDD